MDFKKFFKEFAELLKTCPSNTEVEYSGKTYKFRFLKEVSPVSTPVELKIVPGEEIIACSPTVGTFFLKSKIGLKTVEEGQKIKKKDVLFLVEVLKVKTDFTLEDLIGKKCIKSKSTEYKTCEEFLVEKILKNSGEVVDYGVELMVLRPVK